MSKINNYFHAKRATDGAAEVLKKAVDRLIAVRERPSWRTEVFNNDILKAVAELERRMEHEDKVFALFAAEENADNDGEE